MRRDSRSPATHPRKYKLTYVLFLSGLPAVCAADGSRSWSGLEGSARTSGCTASGPAAADAGYSCTSYIPRALNETHSVGFAIQVGGQQDGTNPNCCKCFDMEWRSGAARGKHMILQTITPGQTGGSVRQNDMIIMIPGGGVGPEQTGCTNQWGSRYRW